ncbi:MAG: hypothetical protein AAF533_15155, partial [Acidobacteriota bacterium]
AFRVELLAARGVDPDAFTQRLGVAGRQLGAWTFAVVASRDIDPDHVDWQLSLLSRQASAPALRASNVDDTHVALSLFGSGDRLAVLEEGYFGLGSLLGTGRLEMGLEGHVDLESPWPRDELEQLASSDVFPLSLQAALLQEQTVRKALLAAARKETESLEERLRAGGFPLDANALHRVLAGTGSVLEPELEHWGSLPAWVEALGLQGFLAHLREQVAMGTSGDDALRDQPQEAEPEPKGRSLGWYVIPTVVLAGLGGWLGSQSDGRFGLVLGVVLGALVTPVVVLLLRLVASLGKTSSAASEGGDEQGANDDEVWFESLRRAQAEEARRLFATWRDVFLKQRSIEGADEERERPRSLLPTDEDGRRLVVHVRNGEELSHWQQQVGVVRARMLEAELRGIDLREMQEELRGLAGLF